MAIRYSSVKIPHRCVLNAPTTSHFPGYLHVLHFLIIKRSFHRHAAEYRYYSGRTAAQHPNGITFAEQSLPREIATDLYFRIGAFRNSVLCNMTITGLSGSITCNISINRCRKRAIKNTAYKFGSNTSRKGRYDRCFAPCDPRGLSFNNVARRCGLISEQQTSDYELSSSNVEDSVASKNGTLMSEKIFEIPGTTTQSQSPSSNIQTELIMLSLPAIAGQAIEPLAQLMETAYIGRLGPLEMASAGISMSIFNIISKVFNIPLLSVATSFVAEDISQHATKGSNSGIDGMGERKQLPSVSTALLLAVVIGTFEALAMYLGSGVFLNIMGISSASSMRIPAEQFLSLRAIGAPAVVVSLAIQGIFRGFKDTKTPVLCLGLGNLSAVFLFPFLMYFLRLGVVGAAISTVVSQYIVTFFMIWFLNKRTVLSLPSMRSLDFGGYLRSGGFLLGRTVAAVLTITLSTSMAARLGPLSMAAHQICLQVWLSVSLLADAQASAGQALIASSFARGDFSTVKEITYFALKTGLFTGVFLAIILGVSFGSLATLFTNDSEVLGIVRSGLLFVSASQPLNALAYIFDGLHYGISDFSYAACSMMVVGAISCAFLLYAPSMIGLSGVWFGLALFMGLRTLAGYMRLLSKNGPWWFLQQEDVQNFEIAT